MTQTRPTRSDRNGTGDNLLPRRLDTIGVRRNCPHALSRMSARGCYTCFRRPPASSRAFPSVYADVMRVPGRHDRSSQGPSAASTLPLPRSVQEGATPVTLDGQDFATDVARLLGGLLPELARVETSKGTNHSNR
jgi:hypothetical protein